VGVGVARRVRGRAGEQTSGLRSLNPCINPPAYTGALMGLRLLSTVSAPLLHLPGPCAPFIFELCGLCACRIPSPLGFHLGLLHGVDRVFIGVTVGGVKGISCGLEMCNNHLRRQQGKGKGGAIEFECLLADAPAAQRAEVTSAALSGLAV
jgi:hypothetical protein